MAENVDGLVIEIESSSGSATSQIDALNASLATLKKTVGSSTPIKTFSKNYAELVNTINTTQIDTVKLEAVRAFGQILNGLNSVRVSGTVGKNLTALNSAVNGLNVEGLANVTQYASTLSQLGEIKISSTLPKRLQELASFASQIQGKNFSSLKEFTSSLAQLAPLTNSSSASIKTFTNSMKSLSENTQKAASRGRTFNTVLANIRVKTLMVVRAVQMITRSVTKSLSVYGDYIETLNLFKMAMGDAGQEAYEFAEKCQDLLGIDLTQWMKAQGVFNSLAVGFGVASDRASIMSQNLTQLAYDISSFYNISVESAIEKVRSGFSGQIRPVRDLGYDLSQARLEAIALSLGIDKSVKSMTQAEKSQLRYIALMTQLTHVQGDLARTLDSPTNQLRILNAQLDQMYRSIGLTLLPILNKVLPYLNAVLRVIKMIANEIAAMFGYTLPKITEEASLGQVGLDVEDLTDDLDEATGSAEKLKNTLASFDQINLITSKSGGSGSGSGDISSIGGMDFELPTYDFLGDATENKAQEIAEKMMKSIRPVVDLIKGIVLFVVDNIDNIKILLESLAAVTIGKNLVKSITDLFGLTSKQMESVNKFINGLGMILIGFQISFIGGKTMAQGNWLIGILETALGGAVSALGGSLMFGTGGAIIGLSLAITVAVVGFFQEKSKQLYQECQDLFFSLREDAKSLDEVSEAWNTFCGNLTDPEVIEKYNLADELEGNVENIGKAIGELRTQYITGNIIAGEYARNLIDLYGQMEEAAVNHMKAVDEAIIASLNGPFGLYMKARGYDVEGLIAMFTESTAHYEETLEKNMLKLQEYNHYIEQGISVDFYRKKIEEVLAENDKIYKSMSEMEGKTTTVFDSFKDLKINMEDLQSLKDALGEIDKTYDETIANITKELELYKIETNKVLNDPMATEAQKQLAKETLQEAEKYAKEQKDLITDTYIDIIQSFENQAVINWENVYNEKGLQTANSNLSSTMHELDEIFETAYGHASRERTETYFTTLNGLIDEWDNRMDHPKYGSVTKAGMEEYKNYLSELQDDFAYFVDKHDGKTRELTEGQKVYLSGLVDVMGNAKSSMNDYVNTSDYYASINEERMRRMAKETDKNFKDISNSAKNGMTETGVQIEAKIRMIGDMIIREDWCVDPMYKAMWDTADVLKQNGITSRFSQNAVKLMGGVANDITSSKDNIQRAYSMSLTPAENMVVDIGIGIGDQIRQGMLDSQGAVTDGATQLTKGMASAFNTFGEKAYRYFADLANLGAVVLGGMGATVSDSTFNNKFKAPKIKGYATGGFPDSADFFYANENGVPEYVGTMGGRTAVANNTDIVKGVSDGVYRAIKDTGIQNDVKKIASKSAKVVFAPSEEAGKVITQSVNMYSGAGGRY